MVKSNSAEDTVDAIAADADALQHKYGDMLSALLNRFEALDPEMAKRTIEALNDRRRAAQWLATRHPCFAGHIPYQVIACGQRQDVLDVLGRIEHGIFS
jgi:hypothetical protein